MAGGASSLGHPITATVEASRTATAIAGRAHTVYVILVKCQSADLSWMVSRRFAEFSDLHAKLCQKFSTLPPIPSKTWFFTMNAAFVEERRQGLDHYISSIVQMRPVLLCGELKEFLELDAHGVQITDPCIPSPYTVLNDPKFGVNDMVFDDVDGVLFSANEDTHLWSRLDSYISNVRFPWEVKGAMVPVGSMNVWKRDENAEWAVSACEYFDCQATCIAYDHERRYIFVGLHNGNTNIYRVNDVFTEVRMTAQVPMHGLRVSGMVYNAEMDVLISCGRDGHLAMYDVGGSKMVTTCDLHESKLMSLEWDREGERVFVGTDSKKIVVVDISGNMFQVSTVLNRHSGPVRALHFVGDEMNLFSGGDLTCIAWNINKRNQAVSRCRPVAAFKGGPSSPVRSIAFSVIHKEVLAGSNNGMLAVWDVTNGGIKHVIEAHTAEITLLRFLTADTFVSVSRDGNITFWRIPPKAPPSRKQSEDAKAADECESDDAVADAYLMDEGVVEASDAPTMRSSSAADALEIFDS